MTSVAKLNKTGNFDPTNFNKQFDDNDKKNNKLPEKSYDKINNNYDTENYDDNILPHKQPIEDIIINIRNLFFQILNIIEDGHNPIPFIYSSNKRQFSFSLFLIIFGSLLLLLSTLMK